jgi:poly(A) polymerase
MDAVAHVELPVSSACVAAVEVVRRLRDHGHSAYLVGGCVRDVVLGLAPKDYDVATDARPQQVKQLFRHVVEVGVAFGVVRVRHRVSEGEVHEIEVATFRADGTYLDGRRPSDVRFTDAREDVLRRDFTLNGLLLDPLDGPSRGLVVDWVGGLADLRAGVLRAIGEPQQRFGEDALRLLRAVRFAARFAMAIDPATQLAVRQLAATLQRVSVERISAEVLAMLTAPTAAQALAWLHDLGLAAVLWPQLLARDPQLRGAARRLAALHRDVSTPLTVFQDALQPAGGVDVALGLAGLADGDLA